MKSNEIRPCRSEVTVLRNKLSNRFDSLVWYVGTPSLNSILAEPAIELITCRIIGSGFALSCPRKQEENAGETFKTPRICKFQLKAQLSSFELAEAEFAMCLKFMVL